MSKIKKIYCIIPVFNDWESLLILVKEIDKLSNENASYFFNLVVVNDASTEEIPIEIEDRNNLLVLN